MLRRAFCAAFISVAAAAASLFVLKSRGLLFETRPDRFEYPCRGAYISERSGAVNWNSLPKENIDFCYIRASRGIAFADRRAEYDMKGAQSSGLPFGAVHDLDPAADGKAQADNFLSVTGDLEGQLIPALDIRLSLGERLRSGDKYKLARIITDFAGRIKEREGCGVVLLCDSYVWKLLSLENSGALIWAEDSGFCEEPLLLSYSDCARSPSMKDEGAVYTALTAGKHITSQEFVRRFAVGKREG